MKRFSEEELYKYWETVSSFMRNLDYDQDPDGLKIVCNLGAPQKVNQYYAYWQKRVYEKLFQCIPHHEGARALDIGCGTGRWCRFLRERGYRVTGIDIAQDFIEFNRKRLPDCEFFVCSCARLSHNRAF